MVSEVIPLSSLAIAIGGIGTYVCIACRYKGEMARGYCEEDFEEGDPSGRASEDSGAGYVAGYCDAEGGGCAGGFGAGGFCWFFTLEERVPWD